MPYDWGNKIKFDIYGSSHGPCVGIKMSGIMAGERVDMDELTDFMLRRAPGRSALSSARRELDFPVFISGLENGYTTGGDLVIEIKNTDARPFDYETIKDVPRPGHADYAVWLKTEGCEDMRGGGKFSGRMTAPLCAAGGVCIQILRRRGIDICAHVYSVAVEMDEPFEPMGESGNVFETIRRSEFPVKSMASGERMKEIIKSAASEGDSVGGIVECMITGLPAGVGGALLDGVESSIAALVFSVPAVKGVEFGKGFSASCVRGSENNDGYCVRGGKVTPLTNNAGGILGGITTGMPVIFRAAFKPVPSISKPQRSVNMKTLEEKEISVPGRHDPCIAPRAVPVVEAAAAIAILDLLERENEL